MLEGLAQCVRALMGFLERALPVVAVPVGYFFLMAGVRWHYVATPTSRLAQAHLKGLQQRWERELSPEAAPEARTSIQHLRVYRDPQRTGQRGRPPLVLGQDVRLTEAAKQRRGGQVVGVAVRPVLGTPTPCPYAVHGLAIVGGPVRE